MITVGTHTCLHNFMADLWNSSEETCGGSRFCRPLSCWLECGDITYKKLPKYMKSEYDKGRVILYPKFPEYSFRDMEYINK